MKMKMLKVKKEKNWTCCSLNTTIINLIQKIRRLVVFPRFKFSNPGEFKKKKFSLKSSFFLTGSHDIKRCGTPKRATPL